MKRLGKIIAGLILIVLLFVLASTFNHRLQLSREEQDMTPMGHSVTVNGHQMNVYTTGRGEETLVFLSGGGTSSPVLDFKSLYDKLAEEFRIVVVEKVGYGFSEVADVDRGIERILADTRAALRQMEIAGPYILVPHSMSGLEALYWAQNFPHEVQAIIGLDMAVPAGYEDFPLSMPMVYLGKFAADTGITRFLPGMAESEAMKHGTLSTEEKELYRKVFYRRTATKPMINEVKAVKNNAKKVAENGEVDIPMLLFSSTGAGTGWDEASWTAFQKEFASQRDNRTLIELDVPHYIHNHAYDEIADEIHHFIEMSR